MRVPAGIALGAVLCALFAHPPVEAEAARRSPAGRWIAEAIRGRAVLERPRIVLDLAEDGSLSGSGGCNRMSGKAKRDGEAIAFGPIAATRMACPPAVMDQEQKFFDALASVRAWRVDEGSGELMLLDDAGRLVILLARR